MLEQDSDHVGDGADLECRNVLIAGRRTSIRMEKVFWWSLTAICRQEGLTMEDLLTRIDGLRGSVNRTAAIRVLVTVYARMACLTEEVEPSAGECRPRRRILDAVIERMLAGRKEASGFVGPAG